MTAKNKTFKYLQSKTRMALSWFQRSTKGDKIESLFSDTHTTQGVFVYMNKSKQGPSEQQD